MFYCPRCKAKVPPEALYCMRCGFNATNARMKALPDSATTTYGSQRPDGPERSQSGITASPVQPAIPPVAPPIMPPPARSLQPETRRVMHPHNANTPFMASPPLAPTPSITSNPGPVMSSTPNVLAPSLPHIPDTPMVATKSQTNPSIPTRPVPSHIQQPTHAHITPAHLLAIQQSPVAPATPSALPATPLFQQTSQVQPGQQSIPAQGQWNAPQTSPPQSMLPQQGRQRQTEPPRPVASNVPRSAESFVVTRNAAERWRTSWRNKQRSEAGPATDVSRGQSAVPEPLMAMQYSLARIRAIVKPQQKKERISVFWVSIVLLACLIVGLAIFILSTYLGPTLPNNASYAPPTISPPTLSSKGTPGVTIHSGQLLHVHGDHFAIGDPILFLLDGANSISGTDGKEIALQVSNQGTFDIAVPVAPSWINGPHVLEAADNKTGQTAYLSFQIGSAMLTNPNSVPGLAFSQSHLNFQAYIGQGNPAEQFISLTNSSNAAISWTAKAVTDDNLSWLAVDSVSTGGTINVGSVARVGIQTIASSLKNTLSAYTGDIIFSIQGQEQLVVPVQLSVQKSAEWIFSPNPVIGVPASQGGACKAGATLTLINLGNVPVFWHILPGSAATNHIQFLLNGKLHMQGVLPPAGQSGDTQVLTLACTNVQNGASYPFTIDANNILWNSVVLVQDS